MDTPPAECTPLERQRSENNHIRDGRWPLRIAALTAAVALILVLMFNFMAPRGGWMRPAPPERQRQSPPPLPRRPHLPHLPRLP